MIQKFRITKRGKKRPTGMGSNFDFAANPTGTVSQDELYRNNRCSLYCLSPDQQSFIFVEGASSAQLEQASFVYQTQFIKARNILNVPVKFLGREHLVSPADPIFLFSVGRCGSTLFNRLFEALKGSLTLSEPDIYYQLYWMLEKEEISPPNAASLSCIATQNLIMGKEFNNASPLVIKHRSQAFLVADHLTAKMPECKKIFLHRNPENWFASMRRTFNSDIVYAAEYWIKMAKRYLKFKQLDIDFICLSYENFMKNPKAAFNNFLLECEISETVSDEEISQILNKDSQEDSGFSRQELKHKNLTSPADIEKFMKLIQGYETTFNG